MRPWHTVFFAAIAGASLALLGAGATLLHGGISTRPEPSRLEAAVARKLRHLAIPAEARAGKNPLAATPEVLADARVHWADHCAGCHGNDGSGRTPLGRALYPRAPDMRRPETQKLADGELFYIVENGVRLTGMPGWGVPGKEAESWKLVHFIRHLPELGPEEKLLMERLNPRSPSEWREMEEEERFLQGEGAPTTPTVPRHPGH